jgi:hypothetical protein
VSLRNGGTTIAFTNPGSEVGRLVPSMSTCGTFGCGVYDIHPPRQAVTSITMNYGYGGTGTSLDLFSQVLAATPMIATLTLRKTVTPTVAHRAGTVVTYSYLVTNTGNVTLTSVGPADIKFSGTGTPSAITCPMSTLTPGQSMTCSGTYRLTQADVRAGRVVNVAIATGTPPAGPPVTSPPSGAIVLIPSPGISIRKTASPGRYAKGAVIHYRLLVTNTGNETLAGIRIRDSLRGLSAVHCPSTTLSRGRSMTCTATYVATAANVKARSIVNTATATGTPPNAPPVTSRPSTVVVYAQPVVPVTG